MARHLLSDPFAIELDFTIDGLESRFPLVSLVDDGLYLGGARAHGLIDLPEQISHVVRLTADHGYCAHPRLRSETVLALRDSRTQSLEHAWRLARHAAALPTDQPLLVHCQYGLNRSAAVASRILMLRHGIGADEAVARLRARRSPHVLFNESFVEQLRSIPD